MLYSVASVTSSGVQHHSPAVDLPDSGDATYSAARVKSSGVQPHSPAVDLPDSGDTIVLQESRGLVSSPIFLLLIYLILVML
jgi:hypothetical protein